MKVSKQELQDFGLYDSLPQTLKEMADGDYFVFYYSLYILLFIKLNL